MQPEHSPMDGRGLGSRSLVMKNRLMLAPIKIMQAVLMVMLSILISMKSYFSESKIIDFRNSSWINWILAQ
jgi:hypothetical protein